MVLGDLVVVGDAVLAMTITLATVDVDRKKLAKEPGLSTEKMCGYRLRAVSTLFGE